MREGKEHEVPSISSYAEAEKACTSRGKPAARRKLANNTWVERRDAGFAVRLHDTDVVTYYPDGSIRLDTGGWRTVTTKERINRFSPFGISSVKGVWTVFTGVGTASTRRVESRWGDYNITEYGEQPLFSDGMTLVPDGASANGSIYRVADTPDRRGLAEDLEFDAGVKKMLAHYVRTFRLAPQDSGLGDCLFCRIEKPGDVMSDHLLRHLQENYHQWSVLFNAARFAGYLNPAYYRMIMTRDCPDGSVVLSDSGRRAVRRYFNRALLRATAA